MEPGNKRAGGCFLMGALLLGFVGGLATGNVIRGVWAGLALGVAAAVSVWLLDKRRGV